MKDPLMVELNRVLATPRGQLVGAPNYGSAVMRKIHEAMAIDEEASETIRAMKARRARRYLEPTDDDRFAAPNFDLDCVQLATLRALVKFGPWTPRNKRRRWKMPWCLRTGVPDTKRLLRSLVRKGLVRRSATWAFEATDQGREIVGAAASALALRRLGGQHDPHGFAPFKVSPEKILFTVSVDSGRTFTIK